MARYIRDIELHLEEAEVKSEIEWLFRQMNFYQTTWKCEECFCANYKQYGITTMKKHLKELYFFTYAYENGVLHFEAWIREGKKTERGLTDFNTLRITKPYLDNIVELENRLLNKLSVESQWYQKNRVFLDTERKKYEHNEKWFHIIGISAIILLLLVGCLSFATLKASRVEEDSDTKVQESIGEKTKEKIVTDRPDILPEEDSKEEKVIEEDAIKEEMPQEVLNENGINEEIVDEETEHETISVEVEDNILALMQQVYLPIVESAEETDEFAFIFFDSDAIPELLVDSDRQYAIYTIKDEAAYCMVQKNTSVAEEIYEGRGLVSSFARWRGGGDEGSYAVYFYQTGIDMNPIVDDCEATLYFTYDAIYDEEGKYTGDAVKKCYYLGEEVQEKTYEQVIEEWKINRGSEYKEGCVNGIWPRTYSQSDIIYFFNGEVNEKNKVNLNADSLESIVKSSEWKVYKSVDDYGEDGQKAFEKVSIYTDGRGYNNGICYELIDILYDYGLSIGRELMLENWMIERIIPIGEDYYNISIFQEAENIRIDMLMDPEKDEYVILYATCEEGERVTYNDKKYFSQAEWYEYPIEYEGNISVVINNPFLEVYETSTYINMENALKTYLQNALETEEWEIKQIYGCYSLVDYLLESENKIAWFCLDSYRNEFAVEAFCKDKDIYEDK